MLVFNKILLMLHFLGLAMGLSAFFANMTMLGLLKKAAPPEKPVLGRFPPLMARIGRIGLGILIVTGVTMVFTRWAGFAAMPWTFDVKMAAVVLLAIVIGYMQVLEIRMRKADPPAMGALLARMENLGKMAGTLAVLAIIFAVLTFN
ncbi:MAG TPA: hypothetical protein VFH88_06575 [Candidatus Krumholzibacteria bacterium]|nr:hypothetical protein [Candidatus Krumholzibacteria bacterium]